MRRSVRGWRAPLTIVTAALATLFTTSAGAQVKRAEILQEIQNAFETWEGVSCSNLKFEFAGEITSFVSEKEGGILVFFGHDNATWSHEQLTYYTSSDFKLIDKGDLYKATIELNARDWWWSIGKSKDKLDIQTAILHLIPGTIGFYVGADPQSGSLKEFINYDLEIRSLHEMHEKGAQFDYFESGASCTQPPEPPICGNPVAPDAAVTGDAGADTGSADAAPSDAAPADAAAVDTAAADAPPAADAADATDMKSTDAMPPPTQLCIHHSNPNDPSQGKPLRWLQQPIKYWVYIPDRGKLPGSTDTENHDAGVPDGTIVGDGGPQKACTTDQDCPSGFVCKNLVCVSPGSGGDDDGCCRVGHTRSENVHGAIVLLLALGLLVIRRRRR